MKILQKVILQSLVIMMGVLFPSYAQTEISLENYFRTLKSVKVEINHKTYDFLFDSGAGITMVSPGILKDLNTPGILKDLNKSVYGNDIGFRMSGEKIEMKLCDSLDIKIGGIKFHHPYVAAFDIMSLLPEDFKRLDGVISLKTFENNKITLDLNNNKIIVETDDSFKDKINQMDLVPSRFANGSNGTEINIFLGIRAHSRLWWFLFDSGNIAGAKISESTAREWGIDYDGSGMTDIGEYKFPIAGDSLSAPAIIDNIIYDGSLSYDFISQSDFTISFKEEKVWMGKIKKF